MARQTLLDHVSVPLGQIHPMVCNSSPLEAAAAYEMLLRSIFIEGSPRFDLVLLGLGENGHTASLFPDTSVLEEQQRWVGEVFIAEEGLHRLTLTPAAINQAALVVFLVSGFDKALILRKVLQEAQDPRCIPAKLIKPVDGGLLWLVDRDAARLLRQRKE
jgi:6-phosphogluconolactonase